MTAAEPTMEELAERRAIACRLTPDRALVTLEEAEAFLLERGLLTLILRLSAAQPLWCLSRGAVRSRSARVRFLAENQMVVACRTGRTSKHPARQAAPWQKPLSLTSAGRRC